MLITTDIGKTADRSWAVGALALLEDRCEIEAAYRQVNPNLIQNGINGDDTTGNIKFVSSLF